MTSDDRILRKEVEVHAPIEQVWRSWTTREGVTGWFGEDARIDLRPGGRYEIYFSKDEPPATKGCTVLSFIPHEMFSFTWNFPPTLPELRDEKTWIVLRFTPTSPGWTRVELSELGWKSGGRWGEGYEYFDRAWTHVMANLAEHFGRPAPGPGA
jgi:uncharacterized protein YndB with AHSA1/START domain